MCLYLQIQISSCLINSPACVVLMKNAHDKINKKHRLIPFEYVIAKYNPQSDFLWRQMISNSKKFENSVYTEDQILSTI